MTTDKDRKRVIRARMQKTGESYTAARASLLRRRAAPEAATTSLAAPARAGSDDWVSAPGYTDAVIKAKTGRDWAGWLDVLDALGATAMAHKDIAAHIVDRFDVDGWWAQAVTVGYERIRGLRDVGQRRGGLYEASKSRTFSVDVAALFEMFHDPKRRKRWLPDGWARTRTATTGKSIRVDWRDGTQIHLYFAGKGAGKSQVAVQHVKLPSKAAVAEAKAFWTERFDALATMLAGSPWVAASTPGGSGRPGRRLRKSP
jgi:hypothetical protein